MTSIDDNCAKLISSHTINIYKYGFMILFSILTVFNLLIANNLFTPSLYWKWVIPIGMFFMFISLFIAYNFKGGTGFTFMTIFLILTFFIFCYFIGTRLAMNDLNNNTYPKRPFSSLLYRLVAPVNKNLSEEEGTH